MKMSNTYEVTKERCNNLGISEIQTKVISLHRSFVTSFFRLKPI